ncbi:MAG: alpha/beta fold hydrolase [Bacteroidales bacterium]|nr:alpha/beta fold hydrolase [Bacteroidales bacterium]
MIIEINNIRLNVDIFGNKSDSCILLIMGASASKTWWEDDFCEQLASRGRFVIRYDQRDTGESTSYPPGQPGYGMDELAGDAVAILDYFRIEKAGLVGMSLGGKVANIVALMHPERVSFIVFIASGAWDDKYFELPQPSNQMVEYWSSAEKVDWTKEEAVLAHQIRAWEVMNGSGRIFDYEGTKKMILIDNARTESLQSMFNHSNLGGAGQYQRRQGEIKAPVTIIHGTDDPVLPYEHGLYTHQTIPDSKLITLEGAGHQIHRDDWPVILDAIINIGAVK